MTVVAYALWGLFGAGAVEGLQLNQGIRKYRRWPWRSPVEPDFAPWWTSVFVRLVIGSGLATAAGIADQVSGPFGALAIGVASPYIIEQLQRSAQQVYHASKTAYQHDQTILNLGRPDEDERE